MLDVYVSRLVLIATVVAAGAAGARAVPAREQPTSTRPTSQKSDTRKILEPPATKPAFEDAVKTAEKYQVAPGLKLDIFAAEPQVANPVCLWVDDKGRVWVVETFRFDGGGEGEGVYDIRHMYARVDEDLACKTVEDRAKIIRKWENGDLSKLSEWPDRIRLIEDRDNNGRADRSTVFSDDFRDPLDGVASGILVRGEDVYFADIPNLWLLRDEDGDNKVDVRKSLSYGYGVRYNYLGHDLHGLRFGPDGKLYFSIGDRGLHVKTREGKVLDNPDSGSVIRCDADGSNLELFATGLRNPQELAFDEYGNLFTGENNCDNGDPARWCYLVEGGDTGWRVGFQHILTPKATGPWLAEKLYDVEPNNTGKYLIPPLAHIASGPAGLTYYPGTGLPERYKGHFFLCDFRAGPPSRVHSFGMKAKGAGFEVTDLHTFVDHMTATDIEFGPDSAAYITDWNSGFKKNQTGRVWKVSAPELVKSEAVTRTRKLLGEPMFERTTGELIALLADNDSRVRQAAQFSLAMRPGNNVVELLQQTAAKAPTQLARIHAIWALGQVSSRSPKALAPVVKLLDDPDEQIRATAAKVLGDAKITDAGGELISLLGDPSARVQFSAAMAIGKLRYKDPAAISALFKLLADNADKDAFVRHAAVMGLSGIGNAGALVDAKNHPSPSVRIGAVLALRRLGDAGIAFFLSDTSPQVVLETARAINDVPIEKAVKPLADLLNTAKLDDPVLLRALNANFRLGGKENAARLAAAAADTKNTSETMRVQALRMLADFSKPHGADKVLGVWRPLPARDPAIAKDAIEPILKNILASAPDPVRLAAIEGIKKLELKDTSHLVDVVTNKDMAPDVAAAALETMDGFKDSRTDEAVESALKTGKGSLRTAAIKLLARKPDAVKRLDAMLTSKSISDQQAALEALASVDSKQVEPILSVWLDKLSSNKVAPELQLELLEAAEKSTSSAIKEKLIAISAKRPKEDPLANYTETLAGGDAAAGRKIFLERQEVSCLRCHKVSGEGGSVGGVAGPDLSDVGAKKDRKYLLESIVNPNAQIAPGFESVTVRVKAGKNYVGVVKADDEKTIVLDAGDGAVVHIDKKEIAKRTKGLSPMPQDIANPLSKRDIRNLVEFLAGMKQPATQPAPAAPSQPVTAGQ